MLKLLNFWWFQRREGEDGSCFWTEGVRVDKGKALDCEESVLVAVGRTQRTTDNGRSEEGTGR